MKSWTKKAIRYVSGRALLRPQGRTGIALLGHRQYVGGMWDEIGKLQFDFLVSRGMEPKHYLIDVACGALRLGVKAIPYLETGHYLGIEKEAGLVERGLTKELRAGAREEKQPEFVISSSFEFEKFSTRADFAIAQSLFTHLPPSLIEDCFSKLYPALNPGGLFYATYFLGTERTKNPQTAHDHGFFAYRKDEVLAFGSKAGFEPTYIGDWNHPRKQVIVEYRK